MSYIMICLPHYDSSGGHVVVCMINAPHSLRYLNSPQLVALLPSFWASKLLSHHGLPLSAGVQTRTCASGFFRGSQGSNSLGLSCKNLCLLSHLSSTCFCFVRKVTRCSPGCPGTHHGILAVFRYTASASVSQVLGAYELCLHVLFSKASPPPDK